MSAREALDVAREGLRGRLPADPWGIVALELFVDAKVREVMAEGAGANDLSARYEAVCRERDDLAAKLVRIDGHKMDWKNKYYPALARAETAEAALATLRDRVREALHILQAIKDLSRANSVFAEDKMTAVYFYAGKARAALLRDHAALTGQKTTTSNNGDSP